MRDAFGACVLAGSCLAISWLGGAARVAAADLGADCCIDLDARIAELEATAIRKGNRKVSLSIAGHVNKAILSWDDGFEANAYVVGNKNDQSAFSLIGDAEISPGWRSGYDITIRLRDNLSDTVDQNRGDGGEGFTFWQSHWWVENRTLGKLSLGLASRASDTAPESDLSQTAVAAYSGVQDTSGAFALRLADGTLAPVIWADVFNHFNGDTANVVRYDTPVVRGFTVSASWGADDAWDIGLRYSGESGGFAMDGAIAYAELSDGADPVLGNTLGLDHSTVVGSVSVLHQATGLNATFAAGHRAWDNNIVDLDGVARTPEDTRYLYAKLGWLAKLTPYGPTAFYGEYGWFKDFICITEDAALLDALNVTGTAVRIAGNEADVWGMGVVQHIEAAELQIYLGYRRQSAHFDLVDAAGDSVAATDVENFHTVIAGSKISF